MPDETSRHSPAIRMHRLRTILSSARGATADEIADKLGVNRRTAIRYLRSIEAAGEPLYYDELDRKRLWKLQPMRRSDAVELSTSQMLALFLSRRLFDFLEGTGFKEDIDEVFATLEATLKRQDAVIAANLDRKIYDVNEAPHIYEGRLEDVNDILTALIREERLSVTHESTPAPTPATAGNAGAGGASDLIQPELQAFKLDPYTLLVYKKGLYLAGYSHHHRTVRLFSLDRFREIEWLRGERFEYPDAYHPAQLVEGSFGLHSGPSTRVRLRFAPRVARFVSRRRWHPTQQLRATEDGYLEVTMTVAGTVELQSWILSFGQTVEVLEPVDLRQAVAAEFRDSLARYTV